jgi:penicillin G amidase
MALSSSQKSEVESPRPIAILPILQKPRRRRKILRIVALCLLLMLVGVLMYGTWLVRRSWPQTSGTVTLAGLSARAEILRDRWGTPHIYAQNTHDLFFAQGYAQAQDRLWQMEFTRRVGNGQLSSILGPDTLPVDRLMRTLGLRRTAERDWENISAEPREVMQAYSDGVNAYIDSHRRRLSVEFTIFGVDPEPWTPQDILVTVGLMSWILSENASFELSRAHFIARAGDAVAKELLPPYNEGAPFIIPDATNEYSSLKHEPAEHSPLVDALLGTPGPTVGSNSWVVQGKRAANGAPLLANDTHLDLFLPSSWYATGLHSGDFEAVGYSFVGTPGIVLGHNQRIAWGLTDLVADVQDFYIEKLDNPDHPQRYEFQGEWRELEKERETIPVKGSVPVLLEVTRTHHGPLVNNLGGRFKFPQPLALAWSGEKCETAIEAVIRLNRAGNWTEFRNALSLWDGPDLNFVYADRDGNIGSQAVGRVPIRSPKHQGTVPVPGWTREYEWQGYVPPLDLPHQFNPASGFIVAANQKVVSDKYRYHLGYEWADPFRAIRIADLLSTSGALTVDDMKKIEGDNYEGPAKELLPYLNVVSPNDDSERRALDRLRSWNLHCPLNEPGPAIFQVWYRFLIKDTVEDELGSKLTSEYMEYYWVHMPLMVNIMKQQNNPLFDDLRTPQVENRDDIVRRSFSDAIHWLSSHYGRNPDDWKWGKLHTLTFRHRPLGLAQVPVLSEIFNYGPIPDPACDRFTVNAAWFALDDDAESPFTSVAGTSQRIIMDLNSWDDSVAVNSTGQSEHLFDPRRNDEIELWRKLEYHPLFFTRKAVEMDGASVLTLSPVTSTNPGNQHGAPEVK